MKLIAICFIAFSCTTINAVSYFTITFPHKKGKVTYTATNTYHQFYYSAPHKQNPANTYSYRIIRTMNSISGYAEVTKADEKFSFATKVYDSQTWNDDKATKKYKKLQTIIETINPNAPITEETTLCPKAIDL